MAEGSRPIYKDTHDSIVRPGEHGKKRTKGWRDPTEPYRPPPKPVPVLRPRKKRRRQRTNARTVGEREEAVLSALRGAGTVLARDINVPGLTPRQIGYSLGILREHRLVGADRHGSDMRWTAM